MMEDIGQLIDIVLECLVFWGTPIALVIWFIVSLVRFLKTPKTDEKRNMLRKQLIISSVLLGILIALIAALFIMLAIGISHM